LVQRVSALIPTFNHSSYTDVSGAEKKKLKDDGRRVQKRQRQFDTEEKRGDMIIVPLSRPHSPPSPHPPIFRLEPARFDPAIVNLMTVLNKVELSLKFSSQYAKQHGTLT
jgi:hypothetical protein